MVVTNLPCFRYGDVVGGRRRGHGWYRVQRTRVVRLSLWSLLLARTRGSRGRRLVVLLLLLLVRRVYRQKVVVYAAVQVLDYGVFPQAHVARAGICGSIVSSNFTLFFPLLAQEMNDSSATSYV